MQDIRVKIHGKIGFITLCRPHLLNSLTSMMILSIESTLDKWKINENIFAVVIESEGQKAFCAGGDILDLYNQGAKKNFNYARQFWTDEYRLNSKIANYPKPFIAFMQGYTMGGGVGISCHGSHRIVCETSIISLPECSIGLIPDVGGSHLLKKIGSGIGEYLGITGSRMSAQEAIFCNFADFYVPSERWNDLKSELAISKNIESTIQRYAATQLKSNIERLKPFISNIFQEADHRSIVSNLQSCKQLSHALKAIQKNSPLSMAVTLKMLKSNQVSHSVETAIDIESRFVFRAQEFADFQEGVRALIVDKDKKPKWKHKSLDDVTMTEVEELLRPL